MFKLRLGTFIILLLIGLFFLWSITHLSGFQWNNDEGLELAKADLVSHGYTLYNQIWSDQPPIFTWELSSMFAIFGRSVESGRLLVVIHSVLGLLAITLLAKTLSGEKKLAAILALIFLILTPNFFSLSRAIVLTLPAMALAFLSFALIIHARGRPKWALLAGIVLGVGVLEKWMVFPILFLNLFVVWSLSKIGSKKDSYLLLALGFTFPIIITMLFLPLEPAIKQIIFSPLIARGGFGNWDLYDNLTQLGVYLTKENLGLTIMGLYGLIVLIWRRPAASLIFLLFLGFQFSLALLQNPLWVSHHFIGIVLGLAILAGYGTWNIADTWGQKSSLAGLSILIISLVFIPKLIQTDAHLLKSCEYFDFSINNNPPCKSYGEENDMVDKLKRITTQADFVLSDTPMLAFRAGRLTPPWLAVISSKRVGSGQLTDAELIWQTQVYHPKAIVFWRGTLNEFTDYTVWLLNNYYLSEKFDNERKLWLFK